MGSMVESENMDGTKVEASPTGVAATAAIEEQIRDLVRSEAVPASKLSGEPTEELGSDDIAPLIPKIAAPSIAAMEKLICELHEARTYLQSEGERLQREADRYTKISQTALESVKVISTAVGEWGNAGYPVRSSIKRENGFYATLYKNPLPADPPLTSDN
jgi:hypothetical protein